MTNSGRWTITWDAENRAISFASLATSPLASQRKVDCTYDFQGRRVQKIVSTNNGVVWIPVSTNKFIYDGWNLAGIFDGNNNLLNSFTWGSDLSGSLQGAGGVGGLLSMTVYTGVNAGTYNYTYDGNGNVAVIVSAANGTVAGQWEYGPFGEVIRATGPMAKANPIRFSTKYQDDETKLYYYGYRYYDSGVGSWFSRDPVEEGGGLNIYDFLANNPLNEYDLFGMKIMGCIDSYLSGTLKLKEGIDYSKSKDGTYSALRDVQTANHNEYLDDADFAKLVVIRMMKTSVIFILAGADEKANESNLKQHVAARRQIVDSALACEVTYGATRPGGGFTAAMYSLYYKDPLAFYKSINNANTTIACQRISEFIFQTGNKFSRQGYRNYDGVWIPGDWGYIVNTAFTDDGDWNVGGPNNDQDLGLQGENLICTGDDLFWGLFGAITPPMSESWWFNEVKHWVPSHSGKHAIPAWKGKNGVNYTTIGLVQ